MAQIAQRSRAGCYGARSNLMFLVVNMLIRHETDWRRRRCGYEAPLGNDDATGACIVFNIKRKQLSPHQVEKLVRQTAEADGYDTEIIIEQEPGSSGTELTKHYQRNVLPNFHVRVAPVGAARSLVRDRLANMLGYLGRTFRLQQQQNKHRTRPPDLP